MTSFRLIHADVLDGLSSLADASVQCVVTSPPYFGLRNYGIEPSVWGGSAECSHEWDALGVSRSNPDRSSGDHDANGNGVFVDRIARGAQPAKSARGSSVDFGATCSACGAWRGCFGSEPTLQLYVEHSVLIFREVRRVMKPDATLWLNLGDSYANDGKWGGESGGKHVAALHGNSGVGRARKFTGLKPKDLCGVPWRVAFALQDDGWWLRSDIVWSKGNPMPESVADRPTKAHEMIFLMAKSQRYFYDADAIKEPGTNRPPGNSPDNKYESASRSDVRHRTAANLSKIGAVEWRNKRSVWTITSQPFSDAHFATFPEEIPRTCILAGSRLGDTVLDPFSGAATTGVVAIRHERNYVGIELNPKYVEMSRRRLESVAPMFAKEAQPEDDAVTTTKLTINQSSMFDPNEGTP